MSEEANEITPPEGKSKLKLLIVLAVMLIGEAGLIVGAMMMLGAEPAVSTAGVPELDPAQAELARISEVLVLDGKLPNAKTGVTYIYDTEIYVQVKNLHASRVEDHLAQFANEIRAEVRAIWRQSDPSDFQEPKLETLSRKVTSMMRQRIGDDEDSGEPVVGKCVIVMGTGFRVDS